MNFIESIKKLLTYEEIETQNKLKDNENNISYDTRKEKQEKTPTVFPDYEKNLEYIKKRFSYPENNDVIIREFTIFKNTRAFLVFYDGMVDTDNLDLAIIKPLLEIPQFTKSADNNDIATKLTSHSQVKQSNDFDEIADSVNFGECCLFVDKTNVGFVYDVKNWGHRSVEKPEIEQSIYGPKESFCEILRNNSALIRKIVKDENLICKQIKVGTKSKTRGVIMYIKDIANNSLVEEVQYRINSISVDYIFAIEELSHFIEEKTYMITPEILETERPDRASRAICEGRVCVLLAGSPKALILPTNIFELTHSVSDSYLRFPYANMARLLRLMAMFITMLLPAFYLAITLFHQELIPTSLAFSISSARENVPFPSVVELLIMNFSFEMIQEAGIRMPSPIGSTLGIVGGLILGQAAVSAKIVSPLMIIIIAITGLGSFATSDYSLGWSFRIMRIIFIILASTLGFYGIALGIFVYTVFLAKQTSFGVPYVAPIIYSKRGSISHSLFVNPIWKNENRPAYLKTKYSKSEDYISKKWKKRK